MHLIVNGRAAGDPALRDAVGRIRDRGHRLTARVTWESGDGARYDAVATTQGLLP